MPEPRRVRITHLESHSRYPRGFPVAVDPSQIVQYRDLGAGRLEVTLRRAAPALTLVAPADGEDDVIARWQDDGALEPGYDTAIVRYVEVDPEAAALRRDLRYNG